MAARGSQQTIKRKELVGKLNPVCLKAFSEAAQAAKRRGNPYVELVHFITALADTERSDMAILLESAEDTATQRLARRMTIFRQVGKQFRRSAETHVVQLYKAAELARALRQTGFRVQMMRGYGALKFRKAKAGFVATKPAKHQ